MLLLIKRIRLFKRLSKAFPKKYKKDVAVVCKKIPFTALLNALRLFSDDTSDWLLTTGETVSLPYRIYTEDKIKNPEKRFTSTQAVIYHCVFSRSYDGYAREEHIKALLKGETPEWTLPYIIKVCDEYVAEILETVYKSLQGKDLKEYKRLCSININNIKIAHSRMISYHNEFYRDKCYYYKDYIGKKLYAECFGYRKTGQKYIEEETV